MSGPTEPPPSYDEAQKMMTGQGQHPQQYPPQQDLYQGAKPPDSYSGNPPYPAQAGQPVPYPTQPGVGQQPYPYGQPTIPPQGAYPPPQGAYPPPQGAYPPGTYVHPTVGYSPAGGVVVQNQGGPVAVSSATYGPQTLQAQRKKQIVIGVVVAIVILVIFIIIVTTLT